MLILRIVRRVIEEEIEGERRDARGYKRKQEMEEVVKRDKRDEEKEKEHYIPYSII